MRNVLAVTVHNRMKGKRVEVMGAFVTDAEHGWNEIHPVSRMTIIH
jgi:hypothetical protein